MGTNLHDRRAVGACYRTTRPWRQVPEAVAQKAEEDLLAEVQRLRAENEYLKNLQALVLEDEQHRHKKRW